MAIGGIIPALLTPFDDSGEVDRAALRRYVSHLASRADGLFVCGSYGSGPLMTSDQRKAVAEIVVNEVNGKIPVILHVGAPDTASTLDLGKHAASIGIAAIGAVTPYYYRHAEGDIEDHYGRLIDEVSIPVIAYNNPKYTNFSIPGSMLARLANRGLAGVKDSSGDISLFYDYISSVRTSGFTFLIGSQTLLLPALIMGGHGCVSGLGNLFPEFLNTILETWRSGEPAAAAEMQAHANRLRKLTGPGIPIPFYHAALSLYGIDIGVPRKPFKPLSDADVARIRDGLQDMGMLDVAGDNGVRSA